MTVSAGDVVKVVPLDDESDEWNDPRNGWVFVQATRTGNTGYVPIDYLEPAQPSAKKKPSSVSSSPSQSSVGHGVSSASKAPPQPPLESPSPEGQGMRMSLASLLDRGSDQQRRNESPGDAHTEQKSQSPGGQNTPYNKTPGGRSGDLSFLSNTPAAEKKIAADSLPFGLGESPGYGQHSSFSGTKSAGAASKLGGPSKLLKASKSVQNMVRATNTMAASRVPSLSTAAEREDFEELIKRNDEYFTRLLASQAETFDSLTDMVDALTKKLNDSTKSSNDLVSKLSELDELIDEEKRKWKQQNEAEKNADIIGRSKDLIRGEDEE